MGHNNDLWSEQTEDNKSLWSSDVKVGTGVLKNKKKTEKCYEDHRPRYLYFFTSSVPCRLFLFFLYLCKSSYGLLKWYLGKDRNYEPSTTNIYFHLISEEKNVLSKKTKRINTNKFNHKDKRSYSKCNQKRKKNLTVGKVDKHSTT